MRIKDQNVKRGKLIIVSGPSGVGKSTICKEVVRRLDDVHLSVSATTRPPGPGEEDGRDYWFIDKDEFRSRIEQGLLLEYAEVFGNLYGTPKDKVEEALAAGQTVILEIDVQGGKQVKSVCPDAVLVFIMPPDDSALVSRLGGRGRDSAEAVETRLGGAENEIAAARQCYDHMVVNEDLERAIAEVTQIIRSDADDAAGHDENSGEQ